MRYVHVCEVRKHSVRVRALYLWCSLLFSIGPTMYVLSHATWPDNGISTFSLSPSLSLSLPPFLSQLEAAAAGIERANRHNQIGRSRGTRTRQEGRKEGYEFTSARSTTIASSPRSSGANPTYVSGLWHVYGRTDRLADRARSRPAAPSSRGHFESLSN